MAIALRACTAAPNTAGLATASVVLNKPTGTVSGDLMVACITVDGTTTSNYTTDTWTPLPTGWTQLDSATNTGIGGFVFYKVAGASEPTSYTFTKSESGQFADESIIAYSGVDNTTPFDVTGSHAVGTAALSVPSITTVTNGAMLLLLGGNWAGTAPTLQSGFTNESNQTDGNVIADHAQATAGATGTASYSAGSTPQVAFLLALRPAGGGSIVSGSANEQSNSALVESAARVQAPATEQANAAITEAGQIVAPANVQSNTAIGQAAQIVAPASVQSNAALSVVARIITPSGLTLQSNAAITAPAQVVEPSAPLQSNSVLAATGGQLGANILVSNSALSVVARIITPSATIQANAAVAEAARIVAAALAAVQSNSVLAATGGALGQKQPGSCTLSAAYALGSCTLSVAAPTVTLAAAVAALGTCTLSVVAPTVTLSAAAALGSVTLAAIVGELVGV